MTLLHLIVASNETSSQLNLLKEQMQKFMNLLNAQQSSSILAVITESHINITVTLTKSVVSWIKHDIN